ncbi:response regulator transcription factor [Nocardioides panaciterrulae]|uniref:DNA-binding response OmpR family regulator n=1 Tax=Nocardioides panaciterrulae TaxID=661492 RepID=A0A7Y9E7H7_9ACTN|nr:response regulator transcription factor [Nocardioides panaciterrulae]NYD42634.1 DNA-binding response OmpR family regulator [Nocardioides panaciterrulae]
MVELLVVEDEEKIGQLLVSSLGANGYQVTWFRSGAEAVQAALGASFDLVLLDLGLPDLDGIEVCRLIKRHQPQSLVVVLTARRDEMDVIEGLEAGADDYLTKPFRMAELLARVRAHLRRSSVGDFGSQTTFSGGELVLDTAARRCLVRDREVALRPKEFDLLARLAAEAGRAVTREALMDDVWDRNWFGSTKTLDVHIAALRHRLCEAAESFEPAAVVPAITTLRGHGYRLESPEANPFR